MKKLLKPTVWIASAVVIGGIAAAAWIYSRSTAPRVPAGPPESLTIAVNTKFIGSALVLIASEKAYFKAEGLEVTLQSHASGQTALNSVMAANAGLATVADTPLVIAAVLGRPVLIVATVASQISDHGIIARKDSGIATAADLRGKRVGLTSGTSAHFMFDTFLLHHKMSPAQVHITNLKPDELPHALLSGKVDVVATWSTYLDPLEQALGENGVRFSGGEISQYTFNLAGPADYIKANPEVMKKVLRALDRAQRFVSEQPAQANTIIAGAVGVERMALDTMLPRYRLRLGLEQGLLTLLEDQSRWAIRNGHTGHTAVPNFLHFLYPDAMAAVKPEALTIIR